jgi:hypothetical protein
MTVEKFYTFAFIFIVLGLFGFIEWRARRDTKMKRRKNRRKGRKAVPPKELPDTHGK